MSYLERLQDIIDKHNASSANYADYPAEIAEFAHEVYEEELRSTHEQLELAIADLLMPDDPHAETDWQQIKELSRKLLANLKSSGKLVDNWYNKPDMNSGVKMAIVEVLQHLPASYSPDLYKQKCEETYHHIRTY